VSGRCLAILSVQFAREILDVEKILAECAEDSSNRKRTGNSSKPPSENAGRAASPKAPTYLLGMRRISNAGFLLKTRALKVFLRKPIVLKNRRPRRGRPTNYFSLVGE
jgi:hypothetical protein